MSNKDVVAMIDRQNKRNEERHARPDAELVVAALAGSRSSFDLLVERYRDQVFRLAYMKVGNAQEAEDLAQDAFVAAYQSLGQLREHDRFAAWLRRIAENRCNLHLRRNQFRIVPLADNLLQGEDPRQSLEQRMIRAEIMEALGRLSETNRLSAILFFIDNFSQNEIAEFLDLPLTTIKRRINLARTQLKKEMLDMMKESLGKEKPTPDFSDKVSIKIDIIRWYRRFSEYIDVGQNLVSTLAHLAHEDYHETILNETRAILEAIQNGKTLSEAMAEHAPTLGTPMAAGMVQAGEIGGVLEHSARIIVSWLEMEDTRARVDAAYWLRTLAFMLRAGVGLLHAVQTMKSVPVSESLIDLSDRLTEEIYNGGFADGFLDYPVFGASSIVLLKAGEKSGTLDTALELAAVDMMRGAFDQIAPATGIKADPDLMDALQSQISDPSPNLRLGALIALEHLLIDSAEDNCITSFISALTDTDARIREFAAQALERHPSQSAVTMLAKAVDDPAAAVRKHALLALFAADADAAMEKVISKGWDESPDVRRVEVCVLANRDSSEAISRLIQALDDPELLVSQPATEALIKIRETALDPLLEAVQSKLPDISGMRWNTLRQMNEGLAREVVLRALSLPDLAGDLRVQLLCKLASVATIDDSPLLLEALTEVPFGLQWEVMRAVGRLKLRKVVPWLISWFDHPEPSVWWWAADALKKIGDASCVPAIAARLEALVDGKYEAEPGTHIAAVALKLIDVISEFGARDYAGLVLKAISTFKAGSEYLARIATPAETKQMAKLLVGSDNDLAVLAGRFFLALADRGKQGLSLVKDAGAMVQLNRAAKSGQPGVRNAAVAVLRRFSEMTK